MKCHLSRLVSIIMGQVMFGSQSFSSIEFDLRFTGSDRNHLAQVNSAQVRFTTAAIVLRCMPHAEKHLPLYRWLKLLRGVIHLAKVRRRWSLQGAFLRRVKTRCRMPCDSFSHLYSGKRFSAPGMQRRTFGDVVFSTNEETTHATMFVCFTSIADLSIILLEPNGYDHAL